MILRNIFSFRPLSYTTLIQICSRNSGSVATAFQNDRDPAPYFFNEEVQELLKIVTRPIPEKVFKNRLDGHKITEPKYKFVTDAQLKELLQKSEKKMAELLQMPPVVKVRKEINRILSKDPALQGYSTAKYVFTDISYGRNNKNRMITVREPNGDLRLANNEERDRLNQIYFPIKGREVYTPKMFERQYIEVVLSRGDYEFVLDRACIQFDPDHEKYHEVSQLTYEMVNEKMEFNKLRSTRHYGPMVFYLAWNKKIDNLLIENIETGRIEDAALTISLYYRLHSSEIANKKKDHVEYIQHYIQHDASTKQKLDQVLKMYLETENEKRKIEENINIAHGRRKTS